MAEVSNQCRIKGGNVLSGTSHQTLEVALASRLFAAKLSEAFHTEEGVRSGVREALNREFIHAAFKGLPLETVLSLENAFTVFRQAYGWQKYLAAPERGVRALISQCIFLCWDPMKQAADSVKEAAIAAAEAADFSSKSQRSVTSVSDHYREALLRETILEGAKCSIEKWHKETLEQLHNLLEAECRRPAPEHFLALKSALGSSHSDPHHLTTEPESTAKSPEESWSQFYMGWMMKLNRKGQWQRRWVVLSLKQQTLWYFKDPEEAPARALYSLSGAKLIPEVPLLDSEGSQMVFRLVLPLEPIRRLSNSPMKLLASPLKAPVQTVLTLKADSVSTKDQWIDMLQKAIAGVAPSWTGSHKPLPRSSPSQDSQESIERKISTVVFDDSKMEDQESVEDFDDEELAAKQAAQEAALIEEIQSQAATKKLTDEDRRVLTLVIECCRGYVKEAHSRLADLTAKVVAAGVLDRSEAELYDELLGAVLDAQD